jgi:hypothetical protein
MDPMHQMKWKPGPLDTLRGPVFVSATRFTYKHFWHLPPVFSHGLALRSNWPTIEGAVGMTIAGDLLSKTTFTLSVWRSEDDLRRWISSPQHLALMREFRSKLRGSAAVGWATEDFVLADAWTRAMTEVRIKN